jgi:hypothetical protein
MKILLRDLYATRQRRQRSLDFRVSASLFYIPLFTSLLNSREHYLLFRALQMAQTKKSFMMEYSQGDLKECLFDVYIGEWNLRGVGALPTSIDLSKGKLVIPKDGKINGHLLAPGCTSMSTCQNPFCGDIHKTFFVPAATTSFYDSGGYIRCPTCLFLTIPEAELLTACTWRVKDDANKWCPWVIVPKGHVLYLPYRVVKSLVLLPQGFQFEV